MAWSRNKPVPPPRDHTEVVTTPDSVDVKTIAVVRSPYKERHGTPRQAVMPPEMTRAPVVGQVVLDTTVVPETALRALDGFDRIWLITHLHLNPKWGPLVKTPRGGPRKGVLATRSPHHPNPMGLSAVELVRIDGPVLHVRGLDLIDGTPVLDIKPYVPFCDAFPGSADGWISGD